MENLRQRQAATLATSQERLRRAEERLVVERGQSERLRHALDELTEDISRETYGRRREVSLRLALLSREERLSEGIRRWTLKARESMRRSNSICDACSQVLGKVIEGAEGILRRLEDVDPTVTGSEARMAASQSTITSLVVELQRETDRRLFLERQFAIADIEGQELAKSPPSKSAVPATMRSGSPSSPTSTPSSSTLPSFTSIRSPSESSSALGPNEEVKPSESDVKFPTVIVSEPSVTDVPVEAIDTEDSHESAVPSRAIIDDSGQRSSQEDSHKNCPPHTFETPIEGCANKGTGIGMPSSSEIESTPEFGPSSFATDPKHDYLSVTDLPPAAEPVHEPDHSVLSGFSDIYVDEHPQECGVSESDAHGVPFPADESKSTQIVVDEEAVSEGLHVVGAAPHLDSALQNLLDQLRTIDNRYDGLQRSFRDCHISMEQVKEDLNALDDSAIAHNMGIAVQRLDDYCEDARVELEIRVADEERIAKGYETLLSVPGALSEEINGGEANRQIEAFLDGTDPAVRRSLELLKHKLEDLQHDIAKVKHVMHGIKASPEAAEPEPSEETTKPSSSSGWGSWTTSILSHSRPSSPAPTFGSVVTSHRLRHSSSFQQRGVHDPFENMGLRIAMPSRQVSPPMLSSEVHSRPSPRPRVSSAMFTVGIGGGNSGPFGLSSRKKSFASAISGSALASPSHSMDEDVE